MATIQEVILNNDWRSASFADSTDVNRLIQSGITTGVSEQAQAILNAIDYENVQSTVTIGISDYDWVEQNLGDASDTDAVSLAPFFEEMTAKTFYGNQWWEVRTIQNDLLRTTEPNRLVLNKVGSYWATQWNRIITATVSGMSDIAEITVGDGIAEFSRTMVISAMVLKGDMGFDKLSDMYMNSTTFADQLTKQEASGTTLFTQGYMKRSVEVNGVVTFVDTNETVWLYDGTVPVVLDDTMATGNIALISNGAFATAQTNLDNPLMYLNSPKAGNGAGKEEWGTKALYVMHPVGFTFVGTLGVDYASKSGLSLAELQGGGLYELQVDAKLAPITILKVKVG